MRYPIAVLLALLSASLSFAQSNDPNRLVYDEGDNPPHWCRNGHFPALTADYRVGSTVRSSAMLGDDQETCPSDDPGKCEMQKKLESGTAIAVSKQLGDFYCVFDPRDQSAGWLLGTDISFAPETAPKDSDWVGEWSDGTSRITIEQSADGLKVSGQALWCGATLDNGEQVIHDGSLEFVAKAEKDRLVLRAADEFECAAELINLGQFLVVRDNGNCGGANVRFNSVYARK